MDFEKGPQPETCQIYFQPWLSEVEEEIAVDGMVTKREIISDNLTSLRDNEGLNSRRYPITF